MKRALVLGLLSLGLACDDAAETAARAADQAGGAVGATAGAAGSSSGAGASVGPSAGNSGASGAAGDGGASGSSATAGSSGASGSSVAAGASGVSGAAGGAAAGGTSAAAGAAGHDPFPVLVDEGGPKLTHVELFTITYPGYVYESEIAAFADWIPESQWLSVVGQDYGIGQGTHVGHAVIQADAPAVIGDDQIQAMLLAMIEAGELPVPTAQTLFMLFLPETTTVTLFDSPSCKSFGAYHGSAGKAPSFAYAVEPACPGTTFGPDELSGIEVAASHELIEAATDAHPQSAPAWVLQPSSSNAFAYIGSENGDLCAHQPLAQDGFWVQRSWSIAAAAAGKNPCVPVPVGETYCNVTVVGDAIRGLKPGESTVFEVVGWSLGDVPDWQIDFQQKLGDFPVALSLDRATLNAGQSAHLTVTVPADAQASSSSGFVVRSLRNGDTDDYTMWPMAVFVTAP